MKKYLFLLDILLFIVGISKAQHIETLQQGKSTSIRGLSVLDDNTAWISGSKGTIAITIDGGKTWDWKQVKGFEKSDFRDIQAFSAKEAIIMSSGTPALILKTTDGGESWQVKYKNADTSYFFDAMDFVGKKHGLVLGDPIGGKFVLMETKDGGETWNPFKNLPDALPGEACFAASGTCLRVEKDLINIVTGGYHSRMLTYINNQDYWMEADLKLAHKKQSQGTFSYASNGSTQIFVGGDYANDHKKDSVASYIVYCCYAPPQYSPQKSPEGFQSCVEFISNSTFLSTGTPGSNITTDGGKTWSKIDDASYNVCRKAKHGTLVLLAGDKGRIGIFKP
jgi:photosystem II stability/assembly factor-like uncharacterized protein